MNNKKQPTIYDIAAHLGVSTGTVNRALNNKGRISEDTRKRVLAAAEELGYKAYAPYSGTSFDLMSGEFVRVTEGKPIVKTAGRGRAVSPVFMRLVAAAEKLLKVCRTLEGRANKELARYADQIEKLIEKMEK